MHLIYISFRRNPAWTRAAIAPRAIKGGESVRRPEKGIRA
jgi:hypothetical protein